MTFLAPTTTYPIGGVTTIFELANALVARGHEVHIVHHLVFGESVAGVDEIGWFEFDSRIQHMFVGQDDPKPEDVPTADIFFGYAPGHPVDSRNGHPVVLIQGIRMFPEEIEKFAFQAPCPKVCVSQFLVEEGASSFDVPVHQFVYVPNGVHQEKFPLVNPIADRRPRVTFLHHGHPQKGCDVAIAALELARARTTVEFDVVSFGTSELPSDFPTWITHFNNPSEAVLVNEIYNRSSVHLCASRVEGFGLTSLEAMSCGAALVTTDNGGSRDFAFHRQTALVSPSNDAEALAGHLLELLSNEDERRTLAEAGWQYAKRFSWAATGEALEAFLVRYLADPEYFKGGGTDPDSFNQRDRTNFL